MLIKKEVALAIINNDAMPPEFNIVEEGDWIDEGKYSHVEVIFSYNDKFYGITDSRSGSHFTFYTYESEEWGDEVECNEVIKVKKITHEWKYKK